MELEIMASNSSVLFPASHGTNFETLKGTFFQICTDFKSVLIMKLFALNAIKQDQT